MNEKLAEELKKYEERYRDVCESLDIYEHDGITVDLITLFNVLCEEEFKLKKVICILRASIDRIQPNLNFQPIYRTLKFIDSKENPVGELQPIISDINKN